MKVSPLEKASCEFLYDAHEAIDINTLTEIVNRAAFASGLAGAKLLTTPEGQLISFECGLYRVEISQTAFPGNSTKYLAAALSQITREEFPEASDVIRSHKAIKSVTVFRVAAPGGKCVTEERATGTVRYAILETGEEVLLIMGLLRTIALSVVAQTETKAVFWGSNSYLLKPEKFNDIARADTLSFLCLHPSFYSLGLIQSGPRQVGMIAMGSEHLVGHGVSIEPGPYSSDYLVSVANGFIRHCIKADSIPANGQTFGPSPDEIFQANYKARGDSSPFEIVIRPIKSIVLGVSQQLEVPEAEEDYISQDGKRLSVSELDPNDPIDAAILQTLKDVQEEKAVEQSAPSILVSFDRQPKRLETSKPKPQKKPSLAAETPVMPAQADNNEIPASLDNYDPPEPAAYSQRSSVHELREMALRMQNSGGHAAEPHENKGFVKKIRSLFG